MSDHDELPDQLIEPSLYAVLKDYGWSTARSADGTFKSEEAEACRLAWQAGHEFGTHTAQAQERERRYSLAADLQEYMYRVSSQVPFEHAQWASERGAALLAALRA